MQSCCPLGGQVIFRWLGHLHKAGIPNQSPGFLISYTLQCHHLTRYIRTALDYWKDRGWLYKEKNGKIVRQNCQTLRSESELHRLFQLVAEPTDGARLSSKYCC